MKPLGYHISEDGTLDPDGDSWYRARCRCGWEQGPLPDAETVVDALMAHVADAEFHRWLEKAKR